MWVNPDQGLTWEQICEKVWKGLTPENQTLLQAYSEQTGLSRNDIMKQSLDRLQDPVEGPALLAGLQQEAERIWFPLGCDPHRESTP